MTVRNVHVRYEDEGLGWEEPREKRRVEDGGGRRRGRRRYRPGFAVGVRLEEFIVRTMGDEKEEKDVPMRS